MEPNLSFTLYRRFYILLSHSDKAGEAEPTA
nr:MAG TPA: hypothetical protein [Caudoviricetes sp.]DAJ55854.1 MAG TPA: hypothetical protein [Caudoviricetes sp.]